MARIIRGIEASIAYLQDQNIDKDIKAANLVNFEKGGFNSLEIKEENTPDEEILFLRIPEEPAETIHTIMDNIQKILDDPNAKGLLAEVFGYSFQHLKENPQATVSESLFYGYSEWIK